MKQLQETVDKVALGIYTGSNGTITITVNWVHDKQPIAKLLLGLRSNDEQTTSIGSLELSWQNDQPYVDMGKLKLEFLPEIAEHITHGLNTSIPQLKGRKMAIVLVRVHKPNEQAAHLADVLIRSESFLGLAKDDEHTRFEFARGMLEQLESIAPDVRTQIIERIKSDPVLRGSSKFRWLMQATGIKPGALIRKRSSLKQVDPKQAKQSQRTPEEVRALLVDFMASEKVSQRDVADALGTSQARLCGFLNDQRKVSALWLGRIEKMIADHYAAKQNAPTKAEYGGLY